LCFSQIYLGGCVSGEITQEGRVAENGTKTYGICGFDGSRKEEAAEFAKDKGGKTHSSL
jgi:hypothetical protein